MAFLVLACRHCGAPPSLSGESLGPDTQVVAGPDLCDRVGAILRDHAGPDTDVILLAPRDFEAQAALEEDVLRAGVHPFRIRFLDAGRVFRDPRDVEVHIRAALGRLRASEGREAAPSRATNRFRGAVPRRSLLLPFARHRVPLPRIDSSTCREARGCDLCIRACPARAITKGHPPRIDAGACTSCGVCVAACPVSAVSHPSLDFGPLEAEAAILADGPHRNLLVACSAALASLRPEGLGPASGLWRLVEVPSLGCLRAADALRLQTMGFDRVIDLRRGLCCPEGDRPFAVVASLLEGLGRPGRVLRWNLEEGPLPRAWSDSLPTEGTTMPSRSSLPAFAAQFGEPGSPVIDLPGRGAGLVSVDAAGCTLCGVCVERCPSGALSMEEPTSGAVRLDFCATACDGCGICADACPERVLSLRLAVDPSRGSERVLLKEDEWVLCRCCGTRVAPRAMIVQIAARTKVPVAFDLCADCKPLLSPERPLIGP